MSQSPFSHLGKKVQLATSRADNFKMLAVEQTATIKKQNEEIKSLKDQHSKNIDIQVKLSNDNDYLKESIAKMCNGCELKATEFCSNCHLRPAADKFGLWGE